MRNDDGSDDVQHAMQVVRQWMALDAQIKRLCQIDLDGQRRRVDLETQSAEQFK